jgi:group II intron reverse transcriptase/maturase
MQTSLRRIAEKSALQRDHRFQNLFMLLTSALLRWSWTRLNKRSAPGIDRMTAWEYGENLESNIAKLVESVKGGWYRAKLILRRFIPKPGGKLRPLGIPATNDKLLQMAVTSILEAIYEAIFLPCSFGYRPKIGAKDAIKEISSQLQFRGYNYIVEADIRGFFDNINHELLLEMLSKKIDDKPFLRLIRKWLKAGIFEKDKVVNPVLGTPQGGIVSPILANIYLHHVLDEWFENVVKAHCRGAAYICRYADDFVCAFQYEEDAKRFYKVLGLRLGKYGLEVAEEKTRIIRFSRWHLTDNTYFEFLGFEFRWGTNRAGNPQIQRRTSRKKLRNSLKIFTEWCKVNRNMKMSELMKRLNSKLRGYYNYYGVRGNYDGLQLFFEEAKKILFKWLNRRSQRKSYTWDAFIKMLKYFRLERPRITERKCPRQLALF